MNKILEEIWDASLADTHGTDDEERQVLDVLIEYEEKLLACLDDEMKKVLEEYNFRQNELAAIYGKREFFCGIRFATKYLLEAMFGE